MMTAKDKEGTIEVRTDLPRTDLKASSTTTPKQVSHNGKAKGNLLGRKPTYKKKKGKK